MRFQPPLQNLFHLPTLQTLLLILCIVNSNGLLNDPNVLCCRGNSGDESFIFFCRLLAGSRHESIGEPCEINTFCTVLPFNRKGPEVVQAPRCHNAYAFSAAICISNSSKSPRCEASAWLTKEPAFETDRGCPRRLFWMVQLTVTTRMLVCVHF